ncbi:MAG: NADAR family protein [Verrucomicrobia bacterium]|nr:NADAR family protein [Verrucomicrobiota bacterium]
MKFTHVLLLLLSVGASVASETPPAKKPKWDDTFDGVVHNEKKIGGFVGEYRWLSNFFPCRVEWEGRIYGSSEAAYQSGKYPPAEREVFTTLDPDAAKKLSRTKPYDTAAWEQRKERTMREVLWAKFSQHPDLAAKLRATGDRLLEETNWWGDEIWGVFKGKGRNLLGQILMDIRERLKTEAPASRKP